MPPIEEVKCEVLVDWELSSLGKAAAFEASRQELFELQRDNVDGFISGRLRRSAGIPTKYLMLGMYRSREAAQGGQGIPQLREFVASHPAADFTNTPPHIEAFGVIHPM